jgi:hypothetical protein
MRITDQRLKKAVLRLIRSYILDRDVDCTEVRREYQALHLYLIRLKQRLRIVCWGVRGDKKFIQTPLPQGGGDEPTQYTE